MTHHAREVVRDDVNSLMTIVHSEGVGENSEQFMTRLSIKPWSTRRQKKHSCYLGYITSLELGKGPFANARYESTDAVETILIDSSPFPCHLVGSRW